MEVIISSKSYNKVMRKILIHLTALQIKPMHDMMFATSYRNWPQDFSLHMVCHFT